jgi:molybdopterin-binding protein
MSDFREGIQYSPGSSSLELHCWRLQVHSQDPRCPIPSSDTLLKPREAAAELGLSVPTIKQWILTGKLATVKTPGGHHLISRSALTPLLKAAPESKEKRERFQRVSGRNQLVGKIVEIKIDGLLAKVVLSVGDQRITSIITADAVREMQLRKGQTAAALMKSTEVMITRV